MAFQVMKPYLSMRSIFHSHAKFSDYKNARIVELLTQKPIGSNKTIKAWIKAVRKMKDNLFIDINDGSCPDKLQVVIDKSMKPKNLSYGASVEVEGTVDINERNQLELKANKLVVVGPCVMNEGYPFGSKVLSNDFIRQFLHLRSRTNDINSVMRIRDAATRALHDYFGSQGYLYIHTPILTSNDCEGAGEVFLVRPENESLLRDMLKKGKSLEAAYFDTKTYLTVSGQLHLEAISRGLGNVYSFGPTFRAENSRSRLHLSEFYMIEAEAVFTNNLSDLLKIIESCIKCVTTQVLNKCESDLLSLQDEHSKEIIDNLIQKPYAILTFQEACSLLNKHFDGQKPSESEGFSKEQELFLVKFLGKIPVFVVEWPQSLKPFYMKQMSDSTKVAAVDLLVPNVGELCGGSVREDDLNLLEKKLQDKGMAKVLDWYLDLRKFGNVPTVGFGMGFERFLQVLTGVGNIKDTIPFPRWPHNCKL